MSSKHTPGPWTCEPNPYTDQRFEYVCYAEGKGSVAKIERHTQNHDDWRARPRAEFEANARLIAAAPDLLEALNDLVRTMLTREFSESDYQAAFRLANAALKKARGIE